MRIHISGASNPNPNPNPQPPTHTLQRFLQKWSILTNEFGNPVCLIWKPSCSLGNVPSQDSGSATVKDQLNSAKTYHTI